MDVVCNNGKMLKWLLTHKLFEILDKAFYEETNVDDVETYFENCEDEYVYGWFENSLLTQDEYAVCVHQLKVLKWLEVNSILIDDDDSPYSLRIDYNTQGRETFNLLLIGEADVGKSTFINAFANYLNFDTLEEAEKARLVHSLIPLHFTLTDDNFRTRHVHFGEDHNLYLASAPGRTPTTPSPNSYIVDAARARIRLIDTPSIVDMGDFDKNVENCRKFLTMMDELKDIHGVCILLKSNSPHLTPCFEYYFKKILTKLKDARNNMMFLFTNSKSTFFRPGASVFPVRRILDEINSKSPSVKVPFTKNNVFCVDNEAFRFLIAKQNDIQFDDDEAENFSQSWERSAYSSNLLAEYLKSLKPTFNPSKEVRIMFPGINTDTTAPRTATPTDQLEYI